VRVNRLYRRQWEDSKEEILRDICQVVGYRGRYVWLVETSVVDARGPSTTKLSRIIYRMIELEPRPTEVGLPKEGEGKIHLNQSAIVLALPILDRRRRTALMFMHPARSHIYQWCEASSRSISPEEYAVLRGEIKSLSPQTAEVAATICYHRGLTTAAGRLTGDGLGILEWYNQQRQQKRL